MNLTERRNRLRELIAGDHLVRPATVFDAISAYSAELVGYEAGFMAGPTTAAAVLGAPNHYLAMLTATELAQQVRRVVRACDIPIVVVAEHGYGNAIHVMRTVEELEAAGASAITLDDPSLPFRYGKSSQIGFQAWPGSGKRIHNPWKVLPLAESVGKMRAALEARQDKSMMIIGRTRSLAVGGDVMVGAEGALEDAIERIKAFEDAGVDAVFVGDIHTREELEAIGAAIKVPIFLNSASRFRLVKEGMTPDQILWANGVRLNVVPSFPFWASVKAIYETQKAMLGMKDGQVPQELEDARLTPELQAQLIKHARYVDWSKRFAGADEDVSD
jgi:oxaloacetate decarboxylase